ncbi:MAG: cytochrome c oxidase subunit II [Actinomycetota bacterium]
MANARGQAKRGGRKLAFLLGGAALLLSGCANKVITKTGQETSNLYNVVLVMATVVFVGVEGAIIWQAVKYRRRKGEESRGLPPQVHGNRQIEIVWTAIPSIIIAVLFVLSMVVYTRVNAEPAADLNIRVTGYQWQWNFDYLGKDGKPVVSEQAKGQNDPATLYLPTGRELHFELISGDGTNDVIHSFFIPAFFFKRDVVPGRVNTFNDFIQPGEEGEYVGECAEFCGDFHNAMVFPLKVVSGPEFDAWFEKEAKKQAQGPQCSPSGSTVDLEAKGIHFDTDCLAAPAKQPFTIDFDNQDSGVPHNVAIYTDDSAAKALFTGDIVTGVKKVPYQVDPLPAGSYFFRCDVHPTAMFGTFIVK